MSEAQTGAVYPNEAAKVAAEMRMWFDAYLEQGFTEDQATAFLTRPLVTVNSAYAPEWNEMAARLNALLNRQLAEDS